MNTFTPIVAILAGLLFASGCAHQSHTRTAEFIPAEYEPFRLPGSGGIEGQAFLVTMSGEVKYGAARSVFLNPVTTYSTEWYVQQCVGHKELNEGDPRAAEFLRETIADGHGRFRFEGLPAGDYYLACPIVWHVDSYNTSGGWAHAKVTVEEGKVTRAIVTRR